MAEEIEVPYYSYADIKTRAYGFLRKYHSSLELPIPIEEILEFEFKINIVPLPGLHRDHEIDGFISSDLTTISVDEYVYESRPGRYRFTLAHEAGNIILHEKYLKAHTFSLINEWKEFTQSISPREYSFLEGHANNFAGLILVPPTQLRKLFGESVSAAEKAGLPLKHNADISDTTVQYIIADLAKKFHVSKDPVRIRLEKDKLLGRIK